MGEERKAGSVMGRGMFGKRKNKPRTVQQMLADAVNDTGGGIVVPDGWAVIERRSDGVAAQKGEVRVIASVNKKADGKRWMQVSVSATPLRRGTVRIPTWTAMDMVKCEWIGKDEYAVMVHPPSRFDVNLNPGVLHWWHCLEGHPLPEFSAPDESVGRTI